MKAKLLVFFVLLSLAGYSQGTLVTGKVTDENGIAMPGVSVQLKGTNTGAITDSNGAFSLQSAGNNSVLVISFIGYETQEITLGSQTSIDVRMVPDLKALEEVVVIGYGTQKKSVVTAAISSVSSEDLANVAPIRIDNALKGLTSGVLVTSSSGQPGAAPRIRIRGNSSINNSEPLYIVDGMPIDGGIEYLNPNDIASIEVLKDAASAAVYGARGSSGVVLVTTKGGVTDKIKVNYSVSQGWQAPWKKLDVLNATEYAVMMNEGRVNSGMAPTYADPYSFGKGTDWQSKVFNYNAPIANHQLSVNGGTDRATYYISAGYLNQEGIVGGNYDRSNFERLTLRSNTSFKLLDTDTRNYLNKFTLGVNVAYTRINSRGIDTNSEYGSILGSAVRLSPILGVYAEDPEATQDLYPGSVLLTDKDGRMFSVPGPDYNEITNPLAQLTLPGAKDYSDKFVTNFSAELTIWDNLKLRSSFGTDLAFYGSDGWTPIYYLGQSTKATYSSVWSLMNRSLVWQVENVLSYDKTFLGNHNITVMVGQSGKKNTGRTLYGYNRNLVEEDPDKANIDFGTGTQANGDRTASGGAWSPATLASLFARVSYDYKERYMFQATVRRDGSSKFGPNNRWSVFPSFSLGWNITNEAFASTFPAWLSTAKVRFSWGKNGNERSLNQFQYTSLTSTGNNYVFGTGNGTVYNGTKPSNLANPDLRWEETKQTDIGLELAFLNNAVTFSVDYFEKVTDGMLMQIPVPDYVGESNPWGNVGNMKNTGVEFDASYRFKTGDWRFRVSANATYLKNVMINLGNESGFLNYDNYQSVGTISRGENGYVWPFYYGFKTNGIFQNMDEVNSYVNGEGDLIQPNAKPGDVRFVDISNDGVITETDKTIIGKGMPDWTFGSSINVGYKNFDFSVVIQGTVGNDVFNATRRVDLAGYANLPSWMLDRWTGEGTSNKIPRFTISDTNGNALPSDLYIQNGSYMRIKNIMLGYTLPVTLTRKAFISSLRVYGAAENLLTLTKYNGLDPEIASGGTSLGIDRGIYPQARIFTLGLNVTF